jgi:hypothetical protein
MKRLIPLLMVLAATAFGAASDVHLTYHWHLHQPIYWPEYAPGLNRYQFAKDSINLKLANSGNYYSGSAYKHPRNNLVNGDGGEYDAVFDKADRVKAYQYGGKNSIGTLSAHGDAGASVSYSGSLQENIWSLGKDGAYGYTAGWNTGYTEARGWTTSGGKPKADMLGMTYHHSFSPLLPESVLRKEIRIFKEIWYTSWDGNPDKSDHSKGFWPIECAFSETMIPILVEEGYEWVIVANSHLARTCQNYMDVAARGSGGWNIDPPNPADRLGPTVPAEQWYSGTRDGRGGAFPAPYAYQAHRARYVDPETGGESRIIVVPMCDYLSYENGYGSMGTGVIDAEIAPFVDSPVLVLMAHDGDNAWGGGASYYEESVPNLMNEAAGKGYQPTTIQQFLADHPPSESDIVHVEDGAWVNAANDWGHPQYINWLWPPARATDDPAYDYNDPRTWIDIENGFAEDWRNWAIIIAAANFCETAEQIANGNGRSVMAWKIQEPYQKNGTYNTPNNSELAWHFFLGGLDSGFMYYGISLDDEVKQTLAANRAIPYAQAAMADNEGGVPDRTPPTVFKPQRWPWNPGGMGWGPLTGYRPIGFDGADPYASDFHVWTLVYDVSGVTNVTLYVREDLNDGVNPLNSNQNETYAGGAEVGPWQAIAMTPRGIGPTEGDNGNTVDFFLTPTHMATHYWARVEKRHDVLLDYYVRAVDAHGNVHRSCIQHVFVGPSHGSGSSVTFSDDPRDCAPLTVSYDAAGGPLEFDDPVYIAISFDGWASTNTYPMSPGGGTVWAYAAGVPDDAPSAVVRFHDGGGTVDDNGGAYWSTALRDCDDPTGPSTVSFDPASPTGCDAITITYHPNDGPLRYAAQAYIHVGHDGWQDVASPDPPMSNTAPNTWVYVYTPPAGCGEVNCAFQDGVDTWDNNAEANWSVAVAGCDPIPLIIAPGRPVIGDDPPEQNAADDAFDLRRDGSYARTIDQGGFGDFGRVYANYDEAALYLGGLDCDMSGDNNGMIVFLGFDTLGDNMSNLWMLAGPPNGLDALHNLVLDPPMDIAIVLGDEWGDGTYTNFNLGNDYNFGQGVYYLSRPEQRFVPVGGVRLSQFDGTGTNATGSTDYDGDRLMNRWEASIPWVSLNAPGGVSAIGTGYIAGVIGSSSVSGNDRFLSGNVLGAAVSGDRAGNNYAYNTPALTALPMYPASYDSDGDAVPDYYELRYFVNLGFLHGGADWDGDGVPDDDEWAAGTDATDPRSFFAVRPERGPSSNAVVLRWPTAIGRTYTLYCFTNLLAEDICIGTNLPAAPVENVYTDRIDRGAARFYRVGATP